MEDDKNLRDALANLSLAEPLIADPSLQSSAEKLEDLVLDEREKPTIPTEIPLIEAEINGFKDKCQLLAPDVSGPARVSVILCPGSYWHVFSRSWVTKRESASIMERPERLNACALGIGAARTLIPLEIIESVGRSPLTSEHVRKVHGDKWPDQLYSVGVQVEQSLAEKKIEVPDDWPSGDIYMGPESIAALEAAVRAVETGVDTVFSDAPTATKRSFVCLRPPGHHCSEENASGFCLINNAHIAIQYAKAKHDITDAVILDFDLHHGDGTQELCWKLGFDNDKTPDVPMGYFSIHDINSFPTEKGFADPARLSAASVCMAAHGTAIWNVHLEPWRDEQEFHKIYETRYSVLFRRAAQFLAQAEERAKANNTRFKPLVVISAGFDGSEFETQSMQRHKVSVPTSFFHRFSLDCGHLANRYSSGRILSLLEGGYSSAAISTGLFSHLMGLHGAAWDRSWISKEAADEFTRGVKTKWKPPPQWPSTGISLGRSLFWKYEPASHESSVPIERQLRTRRRI